MNSILAADAANNCQVILLELLESAGKLVGSHLKTKGWLMELMFTAAGGLEGFKTAANLFLKEVLTSVTTIYSV